MSHNPAPLIIAVGGGKGGVGKSVVSANLACAMARLGMRTVAVDVDLGAANLHTLFGIDRPGATLQALVDGEISSLEEAVMPTAVPRLALVPGSSATVGAANIAFQQKGKLARHIRKLDAEVVVLDVGAGVSFNMVDLWNVADLRLIVASPQLTSLQNSYSFAKIAVHRMLRELCAHEHARALLESSSDRAVTERMGELIARLGSQRSDLALACRHALRGFGARIVGNQIEQPEQREVLQALSRMLRDFLELEVEVLCGISSNPRIHRSVTRRRPYLLEHAQEPDALAFARLAESLLETDLDALRSARASLPLAASAPAEASPACAEPQRRPQVRASEPEASANSGFRIKRVDPSALPSAPRVAALARAR